MRHSFSRRPWRPTSARLRLTLWNVGGLALLLLALGALLRGTLQASLNQAIVQHLGQDAQRVQGDFDHPPPLGLPPDFRRHGPFPGHPRFMDGLDGPLPQRVLGLDGRQLPPFPFAGAWDMDTVAAAARGRTVFSTISIGGGSARILSTPLQRGGHIVGVIQVGMRTTGADLEVSRLTHVLLTLIPLALLLAGAGGALLTGRTLRPVREITQAAGRIEAQHLTDRLPVAGHDEFGALASTFNGMLDRLEDAFTRLTEANQELTQANERLTQAFEQQRRFTADASHELRTPLTVIKANSSLALLEDRPAWEYREALEAVDHAADHTSRLVQDLLLLARADAGQLRLPLSSLELREVVEKTLHTAGCRHDLRLHLEGLASAPAVLGQEGMLVRLFANLLTNALRHTPASGRVLVAAARQGEQVVVTVTDTGCGIAPEHLPHLFERFYRADEARSEAEGGTGLGLAICRSIADAHGGSIEIASAVGAGTTVTVALPAASSAGDQEGAWQATPLPSRPGSLEMPLCPVESSTP